MRATRAVTKVIALIGLVAGLAGPAPGQGSPFTFDGDLVGDLLGISVSAAGDADGDGVVDLVVGAYQGHPDFMGPGFVRLYGGATGGVLRTVFGAAAGDAFGFSVAGAGDVDDDGYDDFVVGAYFEDSTATDAGRVRVFSGFDGSLLLTRDGGGADDWYGYSVSGVGDLNSDGHADILVGAPQTVRLDGRGYAEVVSGIDGTVLFPLTGDNLNDRLGHSVSEAGDVDGNGTPDFVVGPPDRTPPGSTPAEPVSTPAWTRPCCTPSTAPARAASSARPSPARATSTRTPTTT